MRFRTNVGSGTMSASRKHRTSPAAAGRAQIPCRRGPEASIVLTDDTMAEGGRHGRRTSGTVIGDHQVDEVMGVGLRLEATEQTVEVLLLLEIGNDDADRTVTRRRAWKEIPSVSRNGESAVRQSNR